MKINETGNLKLDLSGAKLNGKYYKIQKKNSLYDKKFFLGDSDNQ